VLVQTDPVALRALAADLEAGRLRTRVAEVLPLAQAARAHELNEAGGLRGKVVLAP
jgi:NADPH:quinone reductase-like Zn-dependent oxidoreductase